MRGHTECHIEPNEQDRQAGEVKKGKKVVKEFDTFPNACLRPLGLLNRRRFMSLTLIKATQNWTGLELEH